MILNRNWARTFGLASALLAIAAVTSPVVQAATFVTINTNAAGQGFNDPTAVAPVGGEYRHDARRPAAYRIPGRRGLLGRAPIQFRDDPGQCRVQSTNM
jgi:hypothetical protein